MTNQLQLPYDIWESIVGIFGDELDEEFDIGTPTMSLRGLSQSCKSMVPFCRKYLFSTLILPDDTERSRRFKALITNNPSLISYVRRLEYHLDKGDSDDNCAILDVLKTSSSVLQSIFICAGPHKHQWETLSTSIQFALEHLVQLSTAIELEIVGIKGVPSTLLANAANISRLSLYGTDFRLTEAWPRRTFKPVYLHVGCDSSSAISFLIQRRGQTKDWSVVDFSHLTHAVFDIQNTQQTMVIWKALQVAPVIELLSLDTILPLSWKGFGDALSTYAIHTLRKLKISIMVHDENEDPLSDLVSELEKTAGLNRMEVIFLDVTVDPDVLCRPATPDWFDFDALVTTPGSFPLLKLVQIEILWVIFVDCEETPLELIQEANFPNLQKGKAVEFRFSSDYELV